MASSCEPVFAALRTRGVSHAISACGFSGTVFPTAPSARYDSDAVSFVNLS